MAKCGHWLAGVVVWAALHAGAASALNTFTLPLPSAGEGMYYSNVQASFPNVDWAHLDRLYIPAGHYKFIYLHGLPQRDPASPLVITNQGGQVWVGALGHYYLFAIGGGSGWKLTGRYDAAAQTGDAAFPGHAGGAYANSAGHYGILVDNQLIDNPDGSSAGLTGIGVGSQATAFEIEYVEIRRVGFAGMQFKTDDDGTATMDNVRVHDNYIHDTGSEGFYIGSTQTQPQHTITHLKLYNNRVVRSGTELFQLGQIGDGSEVYNNVFFLGAMDWKSPFQGYQDNASQLNPRLGSFRFHHNIVIGGASSFINFLCGVVSGDVHQNGDLVEVADNYYSHSRLFGPYVARCSDGVTQYRFARNWFGNIVFSYNELDPGQADYNQVFRMGSGGVGNTDPIEIADNIWSGPQTFINNWSDPNQTIGDITAHGNAHVDAIPRLHFVDSGFPADFDYFRIEQWGAVTTTLSPNVPIVYNEGDYVTYQGALYKCIWPGQHSGMQPDLHPDYWQPQAQPADDLRLALDSPIQGIGLLDTVGDVIFANGFD